MSAAGRERFFREIAERVLPERIEEVHVFPALRQGGRECGMAVIAAAPAPGAEGAEGEGGADGAGGSAEGASRGGRYTVYRATYVLTLKGPERGAWESAIVEEAEAPALAVDRVVRGVHERSGGDDEPERLSGAAFRRALVEEPWRSGDSPPA